MKKLASSALKGLLLCGAVVLCAAMLAACSDGDDETPAAVQEQQESEQGENDVPTSHEGMTEYTLTFDANYPFDNTLSYVTDENGKQSFVYASEFTKDDYTYFYQGSGSQTSVTKKGSNSLTLETSGYSYSLNRKTSANSSRVIEKFLFDHYNTKSDDTGTKYTAGDSIVLTQDLTLYCFYKSENADKLNFYTTKQYSMKLGDTVDISEYMNNYNVYITVSDGDESIIKRNGYTIEAVGIGTVTLKATAWDDETKAFYCIISITSDSFAGTALEYKLLGTWRYDGSSSNGTIVFNSDKSGHITAYLNGVSVHDTDFIWNAYESKSGSTTYKYLTLKNADTSSLNGEHELKNLSATQFTLKGYLAFGMPQETTWAKQ